MFYRINNKLISEILTDFHFVVLYPPPVYITSHKLFYPWQVWVNNNWKAESEYDFSINIVSCNILEGRNIDWVFGISRKKFEYLQQKFGILYTQKFLEFIKWSTQMYKDGWSYGIVDTYDDQELESSVYHILVNRNYDFSVYTGPLIKF